MSVDQSARAALYMRVSTKDQLDGDGLARQREDLRWHAGRHGWLIVAEFADEGVNGDLPLTDRPQAARLLELCRRGGVDVVAVSHTSRFGRDANETLDGEEELQRAHVGLVVTEQGIDTRQGGRLILTIHAGIAEDDKRQILEKTERGRRARARKGLWTGGPAPFGYRVESERLAVYETEAVTLREATALIVDEGLTTWEAAQALNGLGLGSRNPQIVGGKLVAAGGGRWVHNHLRRVLLSPTLGGIWTYRCKRQRFDREDPEPITVPIPAILPPARHSALILALSATSTGPQSKQQYYLLSRGRLLGLCGGAHHGVSRKDRGSRFYRCANARPEAEHRCEDQFVHAETVEQLVWSEVVALLSEPDRLIQMAEDGLDLRADMPEVDGDRLDVIDARLATLEEARTTRVVQALKAGVAPALLKSAISELDTEERALAAHRDRLLALRNDGDVRETTVRRLHDLAETARTRLASMPPRDRRAMLDVLDVLDVRVTVTGWRICPVCDGRGKVKGGGKATGESGGRICVTCQAMRRVPSLRVEGVVPREEQANLAAGDVGAADLPDDDAVRAHPQRVAHEATDGHLAAALQ